MINTQVDHFFREFLLVPSKEGTQKEKRKFKIFTPGSLNYEGRCPLLSQEGKGGRGRPADF